MRVYLQKIVTSILSFFLVFFSQAQTDIYTTSTTWTVPAGVFNLTIKVYGGAGGTGGQDCGDGCYNAAAGPVGYVYADFIVTPGDVIGIYPGGYGNNGDNDVSGTGGGTGGTCSYPFGNYNGGNGGNAGSSGASGGGGGGGAASIITINSIIKIVAGGAGGGGGMANLDGSGLAGSSFASSNGTNAGGDGTTPGGDGGGGGGGGGADFASAGGDVHSAGGESAGDGGYIGENSVSGASSVTINGNIAWTSTGQIEITYVSTLPVTWLSFTASKKKNTVVLNWSTAMEQNAKDYEVQQGTDGINWKTIGVVLAAGNSITVQQYSFTDQYPSIGTNHYRLLQRDIDNKIRYSKVVLSIFSNAGSGLKIFPNPVVNGTSMINLNQPSIVSVYNSAGVKLMQKQFPAGASAFDLALLPKGTYFLKTQTDAVLFIIQ